MGDAAIIDCSVLTTNQLLVLFQAVSEEVARRLRDAEDSTSEYTCLSSLHLRDRVHNHLLQHHLCCSHSGALTLAGGAKRGARGVKGTSITRALITGAGGDEEPLRSQSW